MNSAETLQSLADRQSITELIYRYCRAVDRLDIPLGHSIWHEDAVADYGALYKGAGRGVIDLICKLHLQTLHHSHQITNIVIELNGDRAGSESYVTATLRAKQNETLRQMTIWSRYCDQWSRRDGRWGIDQRITVTDFDEVREVTAMQAHDRARRDRSDPSYALLRGI